jgi:hypothetical protein
MGHTCWRQDAVLIPVSEPTMPLGAAYPSEVIMSRLHEEIDMEEHQPDLRESEAYHRWEKIRISQLGYVNNLILGLAVGVLAFETNMMVGHAERFHAGPWWLALPSILFAAVSVVLDLVIAINRLHDFR